MRIHVVAGLVAGLVLVGCGSTGGSGESSVSVDSSSVAGAPAASTDDCAANSPVRGLLKGKLDSDDGVFGHVYNRTPNTLWVWSEWKDATAPCRLLPGQGASFAAKTGEPESASRYAPWRIAPSQGQGDDAGALWLLVTAANDSSSPGVALKLYDPTWWGYPSVKSRYRTASGGKCGSDAFLDTGDLKENAEYRLKGDEQGSVLVKRLADSKEIAREWMPGNTNTDDWARIDLNVESIGKCL